MRMTFTSLILVKQRILPCAEPQCTGLFGVPSHFTVWTTLGKKMSLLWKCSWGLILEKISRQAREFMNRFATWEEVLWNGEKIHYWTCALTFVMCTTYKESMTNHFCFSALSGDIYIVKKFYCNLNCNRQKQIAEGINPVNIFTSSTINKHHGRVKYLWLKEEHEREHILLWQLMSVV